MPPKMEKDEGRGPRISGTLISSMIREVYNTTPGGRAQAEMAAAVMAKQLTEGLTFEQICKIARAEADLVGITPGPIVYRERIETTNQGESQ